MITGGLIFLLGFIIIAAMRLKTVANEGSGQGACSFIFMVIIAAIAAATIAIGLNMKG